MKTPVPESFLCRLRPATLLEKYFDTHVFCEFCEISKNTLFIEHLWATASENLFLSKEIREHSTWFLKLYLSVGALLKKWSPCDVWCELFPNENKQGWRNKEI